MPAALEVGGLVSRNSTTLKSSVPVGVMMGCGSGWISPSGVAGAGERLKAASNDVVNDKPTGAVPGPAAVRWASGPRASSLGHRRQDRHHLELDQVPQFAGDQDHPAGRLQGSP